MDVDRPESDRARSDAREPLSRGSVDAEVIAEEDDLFVPIFAERGLAYIGRSSLEDEDARAVERREDRVDPVGRDRYPGLHLGESGAAGALRDGALYEDREAALVGPDEAGASAVDTHRRR